VPPLGVDELDLEPWASMFDSAASDDWPSIDCRKGLGSRRRIHHFKSRNRCAMSISVRVSRGARGINRWGPGAAARSRGAGPMGSCTGRLQREARRRNKLLCLVLTLKSEKTPRRSTTV